MDRGVCQRKNMENGSEKSRVGADYSGDYSRERPRLKWRAGMQPEANVGIREGARPAVRTGSPGCGGRGTSGAPAPDRTGLLHVALGCLPDGSCPVLGVFMAANLGIGGSLSGLPGGALLKVS